MLHTGDVTDQEASPAAFRRPRPDEVIVIAGVGELAVPVAAVRTALVVVRVVDDRPDDVKRTEADENDAETKQSSAQTAQCLEREGVCNRKQPLDWY